MHSFGAGHSSNAFVFKIDPAHQLPLGRGKGLHATLRNIEPVLTSAVNWQVTKHRKDSSITTIPTSWKNIRKQSFATMIGRSPEPTHHAGRKLVRPFLMTTTPMSSTLTVPCITIFASLPLTTRKPDMAITIKPIEMLNNSSAPLRRGFSCPQ